MAAFSALVARTGFTDELEAHLNRHGVNVIRLDTRPRLVADDEAEALEAAVERFESDAHMTDWTVATDDVDIYEVTSVEGEVIGWSVYAGGGPNDDYEG